MHVATATAAIMLCLITLPLYAHLVPLRPLKERLLARLARLPFGLLPVPAPTSCAAPAPAPAAAASGTAPAAAPVAAAAAGSAAAAAAAPGERVARLQPAAAAAAPPRTEHTLRKAGKSHPIHGVSL